MLIVCKRLLLRMRPGWSQGVEPPLLPHPQPEHPLQEDQKGEPAPATLR